MASFRKSFNFRSGVQVDDDNFIVNPNGLVGIGTSIPTEFLDVRGTTKVVGLMTATDIWTNSIYVSDVGILTAKDVRVGLVSVSYLGIITSSTPSGVVTYYGDGGRLLNLPTSQWLDVDVGLGFTSIFAQGFVGVATNDPRYIFQIGGNPDIGQNGIGINSTGDIYATGIITASRIQLLPGGQITGFVTVFGAVDNDPLFRLTQLGTGDVFVAENQVNDKTPFVINRFGRGFIGTTGDSSGIDGLTIHSGYLRFISATTGNTATDGMLIGEGSSNNGYQNIYSFDKPIKIESQNDEIYILSGKNKVGIGTTLATSALTVKGDLSVSGITSTLIVNAGISSVSISTVTDRLYVGNKIGINTENPIHDLHIVRPNQASVQVVGLNDESFVSIGRNPFNRTDNNGELRFGNNSILLPRSTQTSLDIINYANGNVNSYLHLGSPGISTGAWNWIYGQSQSLLMSLKYDGKFVVGNLNNPERTFTVSGGSTITNELFVGTKLEVADSLTVYGNLNLNSTIDAVRGITGNLDGDINSVGLSTFNIVEVGIASVSQRLNIGDYSQPASNYDYDFSVFNNGLRIFTTSNSVAINTDRTYDGIGFQASSTDALFRGVGIGTTVLTSAVDFRFAGKDAFGGIAWFMLPPTLTTTQRNSLVPSGGAFIYNTTTKNHESYNGTSWFNITNPPYAQVAGISTNINVGTTDGNSSDTTTYPIIAPDLSTGSQRPHLDAGLSYNASTNVLRSNGGYTSDGSAGVQISYATAPNRIVFTVAGVGITSLLLF
jgi:hypothetical protein